MWLYDLELEPLGFRRKGDRYWQCQRRLGLLGDDHVSVYSWSEQRLPAGRFLVELTEFHVTFYRGGEHLHFYYHELADNHWQPAGHTSPNEISRLGLQALVLRADADSVAAALVEALGGVLLPRQERPP
jgi:hypothetical protein